MLELVTANARRNCAGKSRREFLEVGTLALGGLSLAGLLAARARAAETGQTVKDTSVIMLFLTGGPSQIETFDPKMTAPAEYRSVTGDVDSTIPGVALGGTFTGLARHADKLAIVRSFSHDTSDHTKAVEQVVRGGNTIHRAGMGSVAASLRRMGSNATGIPPHVYLSSHEVDRQFDKERLRLLEAAGAGELGGANRPFPVGGDGQLSSDLNLRISRTRLDDRLALHAALDRLNRRVDARGTMKQLDEFERAALELVLGRSRAAFDLSHEDPRLVARYDTSRYPTGITQDRPSTLGRQLLLARRLCEAGCGFITIHNPGWDMHGGDTQMNMPDGMRRLGRPLDHALSAFLEDVAQRGLSGKILLTITGEFGRTPHVKENGGRDHWPRLTPLLFAGGGLRMGQVIGRSSAKAEEPQSDPVTLERVFATVMHVLFDVPSLTARADLPRGVASLLSRSRPIPELV
jgi:uncharacterized protein (DUF1501 family)